MPYSIRKLKKPSVNTKKEICHYEVINSETGESHGKVPDLQRAKKLMSALYANEPK